MPSNNWIRMETSTPDSPKPEQPDAAVDADQGEGKHQSALKQESREFRTVIRRVRQDQAQGGGYAIEIRLQHVEISAEGMHSLAAQPACHFRSETLPRAQKLEIGFFQQAQHRAIAVGGKLTQPIRSDRKHLIVGPETANQEEHSQTQHQNRGCGGDNRQRHLFQCLPRTDSRKR